MSWKFGGNVSQKTLSQASTLVIVRRIISSPDTFSSFDTCTAVMRMVLWLIVNALPHSYRTIYKAKLPHVISILKPSIPSAFVDQPLFPFCLKFWRLISLLLQAPILSTLKNSIGQQGSRQGKSVIDHVNCDTTLRRRSLGGRASNHRCTTHKSQKTWYAGPWKYR